MLALPRCLAMLAHAPRSPASPIAIPCPETFSSDVVARHDAQRAVFERFRVRVGHTLPEHRHFAEDRLLLHHRGDQLPPILGDLDHPATVCESPTPGLLALVRQAVPIVHASSVTGVTDAGRSGPNDGIGPHPAKGITSHMQQSQRPDQQLLPRRRFLALSGMGAASALFLMACGTDDDEVGAANPVTGTSSPTGEATAATAGTAPADASTSTATAGEADTGQVLVGDVLDHRLSSEDWTGDYGWVQFQLHHAWVGGEDAYFIRTDASDADFAREEILVHVPLMANALNAGAGLGAIYLFEDDPDGQATVMNSTPHLEDYSPAFRVISVQGATDLLESAEAIEAAAEAGNVTLERTDIVVNYPVVKWPGGELPHDEVRAVYLGDGQLIEPVDVEEMTVTFKLHSCYPNSRYIVTDVTMPPMADGMKIAPAPAAAALTEAGATAKILVFGNGVEGSGPMGFQKSVTDTVAGDPRWSPYWDHFTFTWAEGKEASVLKSEAEIIAAEEGDQLQRFNGVPDSHPTGFMVNCPVPVVAQVA